MINHQGDSDMVYRQYERGIGLLELMLSLAVIAILLVMATRFFGVTHRAQVLNHASKDMAFILASIQNWQGAHPNYEGLSYAALAEQGLAPDDISADGVLPTWGGCEAAKLVITAQGPNLGQAQVAFEGIDGRVCQGLAGRFTKQHNMMVGASACIADALSCRSRFVLKVHS